jgi:hypothetical protein
MVGLCKTRNIKEAINKKEALSGSPQVEVQTMVVQASALSGFSNGASSSPVTQYEALLAVSESIAAHRDLAVLFRDLAQRLQAVVQFDFVTLILHDPERNVMRRHILASAQPSTVQVGRELPVAEAPGGWGLADPATPAVR